MIRRATANDVPQMVTIGQDMHTESVYRYLPYEPERVEKTIHVCIDHGYASVYKKDGKIIGGFIGLIVPLYFCSHYMASDLALFVLPEARGGLAAPRLVADFMKWAEENGAAEVNITTSTGVLVEQTDYFLKRVGFEHVGGVYKRRLLCA